MSMSFDESDFYGSSDAPAAPNSAEVIEDFAQDEVAEPVQPEAPEQFGQGEVDTTYEAPPAEGAVEEVTPDDQYLDLNQYGDRLVAVKVNGVEELVPASELPNGYMRQADYTRKTQELAAERNEINFWRQVDQAARVDFHGTMKYLADRYGANVAQEAASRQHQDDWGSVNAEPTVDPAIAQLQQQLAPMVQHFEQQRAREHLDQVVQGLSNKYGQDFNPDEVISEAIQRGVFDPAGLEGVYRDIAFERMRAQQAAGRQVQQQAAQQTAQRQQAAQQQAAVVGDGRSAAREAPPVQTPQRFASPGEAARAAMRELGVI